MKSLLNELYQNLETAVLKCNGDVIALSGGLDSTIIAHLMKNKKPIGISVITEDFLALDLSYAQIAANTLDMKLVLKQISTEELLNAIEEVIKILGNFNDIEIRNTVVIYLTIQEVKKMGKGIIITGDGADELFAGYQFLLSKSNEEIQNELERMLKIMHFPSKKIAKHLGVDIETPFLYTDIIKMSKKIPVEQKVNKYEGKVYGKWILRKTFEHKLPRSIVWRTKAPMQDGAGTSELTNFFNAQIPPSDYEKRKKEILENDNVIIRTPESLHYYTIFKRFYKVPINLRGESKFCKYCKYSVEQNSKFCRMCGAYPA